MNLEKIRHLENENRKYYNLIKITSLTFSHLPQFVVNYIYLILLPIRGFQLTQFLKINLNIFNRSL
jgi:hypothetical protein